MIDAAIGAELQAYRGFACPHETFSRECLELIVVEHARAVCRAFVDRFAATVASCSHGVVDAMREWPLRPAAFDDCWTPGVGGLRACMRDRRDETCVLAATQFALDAAAAGMPAQWQVTLRKPAPRLRWGAALLPAGENLDVCSDGRTATVRARAGDQDVLVTLRRWTSCWTADRADDMQTAGIGARRIVLVAPESLEWELYDDVRPRINHAIPAEDLADSLQRASDLLVSGAPAYANWVSTVVRGVIPFLMVDDMFLSGSHADRPGVITCSFPTPPQMLGEMLVHEASHQHFNILTKLGEVHDGSDATLYYSPARRQPRPLPYILLAYHAVGNILLYYRLLQDNGVELSAKSCERVIELGQWRDELEAPLRSTGALTPLGRALWEPIAGRC